MAYSHHFIKKVLKLKEEGMSFIKLSKKFNISVRGIQEWKKGNLPKGTRNKPNVKLDLKLLKKNILDFSDAYLKERAERLGVSSNCISHNLKRLGVTYKKTLIHPKINEEQQQLFQKKIEKYKKQNILIASLN